MKDIDYWLDQIQVLEMGQLGSFKWVVNDGSRDLARFREESRAYEYRLNEINRRMNGPGILGQVTGAECDCAGCDTCGTHCVPGCSSGDGVPCTADD